MLFYNPFFRGGLPRKPVPVNDLYQDRVVVKPVGGGSVINRAYHV